MVGGSGPMQGVPLSSIAHLWPWVHWVAKFAVCGTAVGSQCAQRRRQEAEPLRSRSSITKDCVPGPAARRSVFRAAGLRRVRR